MIEINETFSVAVPPDEVYAVLSDPHAVAECVAGAKLGEQQEDGSFEGAMTVKFSALRVRFSGRVALEVDESARRGTVTARGRDDQGGTKFQATASFSVAGVDDGARSQVSATGEVALSGKLASVIEGAASAVVKRMTQEFVEALRLRCASGSAEFGPAAAAEPVAGQASQPAAGGSGGSTGAAAQGAVPPPPTAVLLLHGFGGSPAGVRAWSEALAAAGFAVSVPRLPGHGTRWRDLEQATADDWYDAASEALTRLGQTHEQVWAMGISLGATLALRLAEQRPSAVAGIVAVNPALTGVSVRLRLPGLARLFRRSCRTVANDVKKPGVTDIGYVRVPLRALRALRRLGTDTSADLGRVSVPVLLATSGEDHVVASGDGERVWAALPAEHRTRATFPNSYHLLPIDNDSDALFERTISFVRSRSLTEAA